MGNKIFEKKVLKALAWNDILSIFAPSNNNAEIAQLVEHDLAKVGVASSSLVFRSSPDEIGIFFDRISA